MHRRRLRAVALGAGVLVTVVVGAAVTERLVGYGKILHRVEVRGTDVSGQSPDDAVAELARLAPQLETEPWIATHGDRELALEPAVIGYRIDPVATVDAARDQGRSRNPIEQLTGTILRLVRPDVVELQATWDSDRLVDVLDVWSATLSEGLQNGGLRFEGATVIEVEPQPGVGLLRAEAERDLRTRFHSAAREEIELIVGETEPEVDADEVARAAAEARAILAEPVILEVEGSEVAITPEGLGSTMKARARGTDLVLGIDAEVFRSVMAPALEPYESSPIDASFAVDGEHVSVVPAVEGRVVDLEPVAEQILDGERRIIADLREEQPERTTAWAESLDITELVSSFTTEYPPGQPRVTNIQRAAELVNDTIVEPGAVFSLNETIGPRNPERGFVEAGAFSEEDGFFDDYGGGVSQFSTTLYNATFFGGYEILEHTPHSIYISRYPMGREATLDYPGLDNVFRNDSDSGILIRASAGPSSVTVTYYGNREGRVVESEGPHVIDEIPVEEEVLETDWLEVGERLVVPGEGGFPGLVVEYFRIIRRPGEPEERQRFTWTYDMRPRQVLVGTREPEPSPPEPEDAPPPPAASAAPASAASAASGRPTGISPSPGTGGRSGPLGAQAPRIATSMRGA